MKKIVAGLVLLLLMGLVEGQEDNLYRYNSLELELEVAGSLELVAESGGAKVQSVKATLNLYPGDNIRQRMLSWESAGKVEQDKVVFEWKDGSLGTKDYSFVAKMKTENKKTRIDRKIHFPISGADGNEKYLVATENIDKDNPKIIAKATELAEGEDDLFKVMFKLAKWVEENVNYELNTLTTGASQKASWVLENKQGVCDEMTSLFIAMARSLGVPVRFVSGISYTTSKLFKENWQPHGWAEVYFPEKGWVGFDITFGEYGYVDVTHIKLREGLDPTEASTKFEWIAQNVKLNAEDLEFSVRVETKGSLSEDEISLKEEILGEEVGIESYNLIKGTVENLENNYAATTLQLAKPDEIKIVGEEKKIVLLGPGEKKDVYWIVKLEDLTEGYWYEFPIMIYSEKNVSVEDTFKAVSGGIEYTRKEIEELVLEDDSKTYSQKIGLECAYEKEIDLGTEREVRCVVKNEGNKNLDNVKLCLGTVCEEAELLINQEKELKIIVKGEERGWHKLIVRVESEDIKKKEILEYMVADKPKISLDVKETKVVKYGENFELNFKIIKDSFAVPKNVAVIFEGKGWENKWEMIGLKNDQEFTVELNSGELSSKNQFKIKWSWEDKEGQRFEEEKEIRILVEGETFGEKIKLWFNGLINLLK